MTQTLKSELGSLSVVDIAFRLRQLAQAFRRGREEQRPPLVRSPDPKITVEDLLDEAAIRLEQVSA